MCTVCTCSTHAQTGTSKHVVTHSVQVAEAGSSNASLYATLDEHNLLMRATSCCGKFQLHVCCVTKVQM